MTRKEYIQKWSEERGKQMVRKIFSVFMTLVMGLEGFLAANTSFLWLFVSFIGLFCFSTPDDGVRIVRGMTDHLPTSMVLTKLLLPYNRKLYDLANALHIMSGTRMHPWRNLGYRYLSWQITFFRVFLMACMRFSGVMLLSFYYSFKRMKVRKDRIARSKRSSWVPYDPEHEKWLKQQLRWIRIEAVLNKVPYIGRPLIEMRIKRYKRKKARLNRRR